MGTDVEVHDWKTAVMGIPKTLTHPTNWHFNFQPSKQIIINKSRNGIKVREIGFNLSIGVAKSICKRGKSWNETTPNLIAKGVVIKPDKLEDIKKLLKNHYEQNWEMNEQLTFYKQLCTDQEELLTQESFEEDGEDDIGEILENENVLGI